MKRLKPFVNYSASYLATIEALEVFLNVFAKLALGPRYDKTKGING